MKKPWSLSGRVHRDQALPSARQRVLGAADEALGLCKRDFRLPWVCLLMTKGTFLAWSPSGLGVLTD